MTQPTFVRFVESLGTTLTLAQRVLAMVAFDGVEPADLPPDERAVARQLFGDVDHVPTSARGVLIVVAGARSGKTRLLALHALWRAFVADLRGLAPGETATALLAAPDLRLARQALAYALGAAQATPALVRLASGVTRDRFVLTRPDGGRVAVECLPATRGGASLRGRTLVCAALDECAFFYDETGAVSDVDLFRAVAPRVLPGGLVVLSSTPWAEAGLLYWEFRRNQGRPTTALACHAPTTVMRAGDPAVEAIVQRERERDPENARREYDAEFAGSVASLLDGEDVDAAVLSGFYGGERQPGTTYGLALDLATRHDLSVVLVGHRELRRQDARPPVEVLVVDYAGHWRPERGRKLDVEQLESEVARLANHYRTRIEADSWGFDFLEARMKVRGVGCQQASMAPAEQARRARLLATMFRQRRVVLPDGNPELLRQLKALQVTHLPGGGLRFAAPDRRGHHDDYPKALLLLVDRAQHIPVSGGDIRSTWIRGQRCWFVRDASGHEMPTHPPLGSRDWLEYCARSRREGFSTPELDTWLGEPANVEALERHIERKASRNRLLLRVH